MAWLCLRSASAALCLLVSGVVVPAGHAQERTLLCPAPVGPVITTTPEPRSGDAKGVGDWRQHVERQRELMVNASFDTYLVGDSQIYNWPLDILQRRRPGRIFNFGVNGDRTENVLWRLQQIAFPAGLRGDIINLIGTNNLDRPACEVVWGIAAVLAEERRQAPAARLVVISLLPRGERLASFVDKIKTINHDLALLSAAQGYTFVPVHDKLLCEAYDKARCHYYTGDHLHLRREGYEVVTDALAAALSRGGKR
ncbi:MAG TPA: GDSL-type esterase/lipase family protein [Vineibacter sp.]|nr:GDSL-type esterase/lipase family protein [Vineibacter sp.]